LFFQELIEKIIFYNFFINFIKYFYFLVKYLNIFKELVFVTRISVLSKSVKIALIKIA
jgi:hypothetical protein